MNSFFKPVMLSGLLSLFVFGELAEAQLFRRTREPMDSVGRNQRIDVPYQPQQQIQNPQPVYQPQPSPSVQSRQPVQQPSRQYQPPSNSGTTRSGTVQVNTSRGFRMAPGDVILEINGEWIGRQEDVSSAIARSPETMYLTVRDGRTGAIARYVTILNSSRPRFGMTHRTNPGGGSRVTGVNSNAPLIYLVQ